MPLRSHHLLRKSSMEGNIPYFRHPFIHGNGFAFFFLVRLEALRSPSAGKPQPYTTSFPTTFPGSWSLVLRLRGTRQDAESWDVPGLLGKDVKASLIMLSSSQLNSLQLVLPVPRDLFYRANDIKTHPSHGSAVRFSQKTLRVFTHRWQHLNSLLST